MNSIINNNKQYVNSNFYLFFFFFFCLLYSKFKWKYCLRKKSENADTHPKHTHAQSLQSFKPRHNFVFLLYLLHVRIQGLCGIPPASNYVIWKWLRIKFEYSTKHKHPPLIFPRHQIHIPTWHMWELACVTGGYTVHPWNNSLWIFEYSFS